MASGTGGREPEIPVQSAWTLGGTIRIALPQGFSLPLSNFRSAMAYDVSVFINSPSEVIRWIQCARRM
jgi:hypothetical protein